MSILSDAVVRRIAGRGCPACEETRCAEPADCLWFLTSRPWGACPDCAGTGWAGEEDPCNLFCPWCAGSGLVEYAPDAELGPDEVTDASVARHAAYIERLTKEAQERP